MLPRLEEKRLKINDRARLFDGNDQRTFFSTFVIFIWSTVTRIDHDRARGSINYNVYQRGKVGFGVWSCITRSGKGGVEKTGRADETGSPGCACSGAREQESGKSGMQASSRPWRFASRGNNSPRNPGEEPFFEWRLSLGEIWMSCVSFPRSWQFPSIACYYSRGYCWILETRSS